MEMYSVNIDYITPNEGRENMSKLLLTSVLMAKQMEQVRSALPTVTQITETIHLTLKWSHLIGICAKL